MINRLVDFALGACVIILFVEVRWLQLKTRRLHRALEAQHRWVRAIQESAVLKPEQP